LASTLRAIFSKQFVVLIIESYQLLATTNYRYNNTQ